MGRPFSEAERAVALDASLTPRQAAERLGRTVGTIRAMRTQDRLSRCEVPVGKHGTFYAWSTYKCRCEPCVQAARAHQRQWEATKPGRRRISNPIPRKTVDDAALVTIPRDEDGRPLVPPKRWTEAELAIALDRSLTRRQAAVLLGRTESAVRRQRDLDRLRDRPVPQGRHGTATAWALHECRCSVCVEFGLAYSRRGQPRSATEHGGEIAADAGGLDAPVRRRWTAAEIAVALDLSLTRAQAAQQLGRTEAAVQWARYSHGVGSTEPPTEAASAVNIDGVPMWRWRHWSVEEIAVALDTSIPIREAARQLGRSMASVKTTRLYYRRNDSGADQAAAHGQQWTGDEIAIAVDRSLSAAEAATRLGRTVNAVRRRRALHNADDQPTPEHLHGTLHAYTVYGCRCLRCQQAAREGSSNRRRA